MVIIALAAAALALLCWPPVRSAVRLRALAVRSPGRPRTPLGRTGVAVSLGAIGAVAFALLGPAGALVGGALGAAGWRRWRSRRAARARIAAIVGVADALGGLVAELRAGAHPAVAAESVANEAGDGAACVALRAVAAAARLGGDAEVALANTAGAADVGVRSTLERLARAWALAQRHGLPLADVLDAVRRDLDASARFAAQLQAKLAGPRASAAVLSCLPVLGVLLGEAMGAQPLEVLGSTGAGQALLLIGGALMFAGTAWCARLTGQVGLP